VIISGPDHWRTRVRVCTCMLNGLLSATAVNIDSGSSASCSVLDLSHRLWGDSVLIISTCYGHEGIVQ
jgi:hypothetical protein